MSFEQKTEKALAQTGPLKDASEVAAKPILQSRDQRIPDQTPS